MCFVSGFMHLFKLLEVFVAGVFVFVCLLVCLCLLVVLDWLVGRRCVILVFLLSFGLWIDC